MISNKIPDGKKITLRPRTLFVLTYVWANTGKFYDGQELRLTKGRKSYVLLADNLSDKRVDHIFKYNNHVYPARQVKIVTRRDLPLYMDWHTGVKFQRLIKGEKI
jgi:hypothetical protein